MRGKVDSAEVNELLVAEGHEDLRFLDNGVISYRMEAIEGHTHAYHLVPGGASKAKGVEFHLRARGYDAESCIAIGDSIEDLESSVVRRAVLLRRERAGKRRGSARGAAPISET